jgi:hypothetical protein
MRSMTVSLLNVPHGNNPNFLGGVPRLATGDLRPSVSMKPLLAPPVATHVAAAR